MNICVGPSELFGFSDSLLIMAIGQALHGLVDPFLLVPSLPEMIESVIHKYPDDEFLINDLSSGIFNCFLGIGQISGPLYGSLMTEHAGFRLTADYVAFILLGFSVIYFFFGSGWSAFRDSRWTNYGEPLHFGGNMFVCTPGLNRSRIIENQSFDYFAHTRKNSLFSQSHVSFGTHQFRNKSQLIF